jgi:hypothetical protein
MPVIDGYRATHLLRHHQPYSTNPELRTIAVVAMTASAIQGDREKCRKAGMDDYLAKPVRSKTLERMLVKWVTEARRTSIPHRLDRSDSSDDDRIGHHSSICTEASRVDMRSNRVDPTDDAAIRPAPRPHASGPDQNVDRAMQRVEAEEKAHRLRDDKLLAASDPTSTQVASPPESKLPLQALTAENISKLVDQTKDHHDSGRSPTLDLMVTGPRESSISGAERGGHNSNNATRYSSSSSHSIVSLLPPGSNARAKFAAGKIRRFESGQSADTVKPRKLSRGGVDDAES